MATRLVSIDALTPASRQELKHRLRRRGIYTYETPPGQRGPSIAALWVHDDSRSEEAGRICEEYFRDLDNRRRKSQQRQDRSPRGRRLLRRTTWRWKLLIALTAAILMVWILTGTGYP